MERSPRAQQILDRVATARNRQRSPAPFPSLGTVSEDTPTEDNHVGPVPAGHVTGDMSNPTPPTADVGEALASALRACAVSAKVPKFLPYDVELWRRQCDAAFHIANVTSQLTRYYHVLSTLDPDVSKRVAHYTATPTAGNEFTGLVDALSTAFSKSDGDRMDELHSLRLGDRRPSDLFYDMERLWLDPIPRDSRVLRYEFKKKLPQQVAMALRSRDHVDCTAFLTRADELMDEYRQSQSFAQANTIASVAPTGNSTDEESDRPLGRVGPHHSPGRARAGGGGSKPPHSPKKNLPKDLKNGICFFHSKYGPNARHCTAGCKFASIPRPTNMVTIAPTQSGPHPEPSPQATLGQGIHVPRSFDSDKRRAVVLPQHVDGREIVVDTGATHSFVPARPQEKKKKPNNTLFRTATGTPIPIYGQRVISLNVGLGTPIRHTFFVADIEDALLGMDFLFHNRLAVDPVNNRLFSVDTFRSVAAKARPISAITATSNMRGEFADLWDQFPSLTNASADRMLAKPKHDVTHDITIAPGTRPAAGKPRRLFGPKLSAARDEINTMLRLGIIRPSKSSWASPMHVAPKGDNGWRPCGDFRYLNSVTVPDKYPLPHIQDFTSDLHGATIFSKVDLVRAFHQIPLAEKAVPLTAITTPFGLFEFTRMPFGLCNAAQAFQRFMDLVTRGLEGIYVYIDDILVVACTEQEHRRRLLALFRRLEEYGLVVNPSKSILGAPSVEFLGFQLSAAGLRPLDSKVAAIARFPAPRTFANLSEFLGMVHFYHRFIPRCSTIAKPLHDLKKMANSKNGASKAIPTAEWGEKQQSSFEALKNVLAKATALTFPDPSAETRLVTDASDVAAGGALEQKIDGAFHPVAFFSKSFSDAERRYSTFDRELLAIKLSLASFRHFIEALPSNSFHVATDHKPLTSGTHFSSTPRSRVESDRAARTWSFISQFTSDIRHISGASNPVADALSRNPVLAVRPNDLLAFVASEQVKAGMVPQPFEPWPDHWHRVSYRGTDVTVDTRGHDHRPVVPPSATKAVFSAFHDLAHVGVKATHKAISGSYTWPSMSKDIAQWVRECPACQASKITVHTKTPFEAFKPPSAKFHTIHVDIVGPLPSVENHSYLLTVVDRFSRWPAAIPLTGISAAQCATALLHHWVQHHGAPQCIVTDRGRQFTSALWSELCHLLGSHHTMTTAYHPQSNGMVERFHRQLKASLMARSTTSTNWLADLPLVMLGLRTALKEDLHCSSAEMLYGQQLALPGTLVSGEAVPGRVSVDPENYVHDLRDRMAALKFTSPTWHGHVGELQRDSRLDTCSHVFVLNSAVKPPLTRPYKGPFKVLSRAAKEFTIQLPSGAQDHVSIDRLKPAFLTDQALEATAPQLPAVPMPRSPPVSRPVQQQQQTTPVTVTTTTTRAGRPVRRPGRFVDVAAPLDFTTFHPASAAEHYALQTTAGVHMPLLDHPQFPDDDIYVGPNLPLH